MLISNAFAQAAPAAAQDPMSSITGILPLIFMFVVLWFLMIRPQMKRAKEHKNLMSSLSKGDEVLTSGGLVGKISKVSDENDFLVLALNDQTQITIKKDYVTAVLPKGTIQSL